MMSFLDENQINYVPVLMHERMVDKDFISLILDFTQSGFDDIVRKSYFKILYPNEVYEDTKTSEMIRLIEKNYVDLLKPVLFVGDDGIMRTQPTKKEFEKYIKEKK
jgi:arsenate reductase-like glutaredoxin family protein